MIRLIKLFLLIFLLSVDFYLFPSLSHADPLVFLSTQLTPVEEADKMRRIILKGYPGEVDFLPNDNNLKILQLSFDKDRAGKNPGLFGGLHGDILSLAKSGKLADVSQVLLNTEGKEFIDKFANMSRMADGSRVFIPWMQATYIMAANRKALRYLPKNVDINRLTYDQFVAWGANINKGTGEPKIGFPVARNGLMHRFIQGYLYPSYTGGMVRKFRAPETFAMWEMMRNLWRYTTPRSLTFSHMHEPLRTGEVWVAWDHTERIMPVVKERPDDFVIFPVPAGPNGRGFMVVLAGLAVPKSAPDLAASISLANYLTRTDVQMKTLRHIGFFPVVLTENDVSIPPGLAAVKNAVSRQAIAPDAIPALLPTGLGKRGRDFNAIYLATFSRIVLRGKDIGTILNNQLKKLRAVIEDAGAACWVPDLPSNGPCPIE